MEKEVEDGAACARHEQFRLCVFLSLGWLWGACLLYGILSYVHDKQLEMASFCRATVAISLLLSACCISYLPFAPSTPASITLNSSFAALYNYACGSLLLFAATYFLIIGDDSVPLTHILFFGWLSFFHGTAHVHVGYLLKLVVDDHRHQQLPIEDAAYSPLLPQHFASTGGRLSILFQVLFPVLGFAILIAHFSDFEGRSVRVFCNLIICNVAMSYMTFFCLAMFLIIFSDMAAY